MNKDQHHLGTEVALITKLFYGALCNRLQGMDIDRYYTLVHYLGSCESPKTQKEIADKFKMDKTVLVRVLDYLSEKGYVERVVNPLDRRAYFIQLTDLAKEKLPTIETAIAEIQSKAFKGFSDDQICNFIANLNDIKKNLFEEPAMDFELNYK